MTKSNDHDCYVYHETEAPKVVKKSEAEELYKDGWADSPAKFAKIKDFGGDPDNEVQVQQIGEAIEGVKNAANGALNLDKMTKSQLEAYAKEHFGVELDMGNIKAVLIDEVRGLVSPETLN